jgi:hypothetical protein
MTKYISQKLNRRQALIKSICGIAVAAGIVSVPSETIAASPYGRYWPSYLMAGDVLVGRRYDKTQWWGYFRHAGLYNGQYVVEGGMEKPARVTTRSLDAFVQSYDEVRVLRMKASPGRNGPKVSYQADLQTGENDYCGKMIRDAYNAAMGTRYKWVYPDNIYVSDAYSEVGFKLD